jgi:hypothetical protein
LHVHWARIERLGSLARIRAESSPEGFGRGTVQVAMAGDDVQRGAAVPVALRRHAGDQLHFGFQGAAHSSSDRDGSAERAIFQGAAGCAATANRTALPFQCAPRDLRPRPGKKERRRGDHDFRPERVSAQGCGRLRPAGCSAARGNFYKSIWTSRKCDLPIASS